MKRLAFAERITAHAFSFSALFKLRGLYFTNGLAGGVFNPYLTLILAHHGLNSSTVGWIMAAGTFASILAQPVWGFIVDRYERTKFVLALSMLIPACAAYFYNLQWVAVISVAYIMSIVFSATYAPIADAYAVEAAKKSNATYGSIRSLGSLGNALGGYLGGLYLSWFSLTSLWLPFAFINLLGLIAILFLPSSTKSKVAAASFTNGVRELLINRRFLLFLAGCFMINQTLTAFNSYFTLSFQLAGGTYAMTGVALLLASATNVPSMLIASRLSAKLGRERLLLIAATAYVLRWGIQWVFPSSDVMIAIQVLHGLSFGFFYIAAVEYVANTAGKRLQATGQSIFNMVFVGLAGIAGNLLNGYLLDIGGPSLMYFACTVSAFLGAGLLLIVSNMRRNTSV
ncbi:MULTISPECIES: MFS transporter [Cohnella]|uniref:MFS transporter n=1 Tax=Cohnella TaxID=329857 RepID=UPI0009BBEFF2|nr:MULTISPECIES: MFS transporter [Cohnella]MBN2984926.1 MFS transporter [Cohnella algarum]